MKGVYLSLAVLILSVLSGGDAIARDTGTYEILEYRVELAPQENGSVTIAYFQKWRVKTGHIPWITVGAANSSYQIMDDGLAGNAAVIRRANSRGWSGVRIDLDRDFQPGETFEVAFSLKHEVLLYSNPKGYCLDFIPGWYDRARIGQLEIALNFFGDLNDVLPNPNPDLIEKQRMLWAFKDLKPGAKKRITVVFPKELFPGNVPLASPASGSRRGPSEIIAYVIGGLIAVVVIAVLVIATKAGKNRYGDGGTVAAAGMHGTRGCVVACACACVACACACACAGGGAAGCDRKIGFTCPLCADCSVETCPVRHSLRA